MKTANLLPVIVLTGIVSSHAGLIFTIEAPGVQSSSVPGVITETFDGFSPGAFSGATALGNLSAGGSVYNADVYGGANGSRFYRPSNTASILTLNSPQNYFGIWWSAGDVQNFLEFFDGATSLGAYNVGDIIPVVNAAYYGNPNPPGGNNGEPYAYLNFTTTGGSHITSVSLRGGNFELDNLSVTDATINPPGTNPDGTPVGTVPDGGATVGLLGLAITGIMAIQRKFRS